MEALATTMAGIDGRGGGIMVLVFFRERMNLPVESRKNESFF